MYLKSIEMRGFKSFVDETKMEFLPGITAVIGPNGCGKSNIADGIRWVLGEQSAKIMRGAKMEDFIFNGSGARKPAGFAEVSLTISNTDGSVTAHPFAEYEEITVTRKLYRTGESEYYINKVPCRLKDIVDVFLDTGVSARAFSIIEQGQITRIVNSKPEDRRFIIEEAAGVMKYKNRRNAAVNKLEASQQNLLRIQDILGELERQRNSLNRQAKKAERYKAYRAELRSRALESYAVELQGKARELDGVAAELEKARENEAALAAQASARRNEAETLSSAIGQDEAGLGKLKEDRARLAAAIERAESHRGLLKRQMEDLAASNERASGEIEENERETARLGELSAARSLEASELSAVIERDSARLGGIKEKSAALRRELLALKEKKSAIEREDTAVLGRMGALRDSQSSLSARIEMMEEKIAELALRREEVSKSLSGAEEKLSSLASNLEARRSDLEKSRERGREIRAALGMSEEALTAAEAELKSVDAEITRLVSRKESLQELDKNLEGFGAGVRALMKMKEDGREGIGGVKGLLADGVRAPREMDAALAAILGARLDAVIMEDCGRSLSAVRLLKQDGAGRAGFLPADLAPRKSGAAQAPEHPSLVGRASDIFTLSGDIPASVAAQLEATLIARDLDGALGIWRTAPGEFTVVTIDGDVIDSSGLITAGSAQSGHGADIVARKRMIEDLAAMAGEKKGERDAIEQRRASLAESVRAERARLEESEASQRSLEMEALELSKEVQKEDEAAAAARARIESLTAERGRALSEKERILKEAEAISAELAALSRRKEEIEAAGAGLRENIEELERALEESLARAQEDEVALTTVRGRWDNLNLDVKRLEGSRADLVARGQRLRDSIRDFAAKRDEALAAISSLEKEGVELAREKDASAARITQLSEALEEKLEKRRLLEREAGDLQDSLDEAREEVSALSIRKSEIEMRVENVIEKADHEFNIPAEDLVNADISEVNVEEVAQRLAFLRGELGRIGDVNMAALEEFEEIDARYEFMKTQHADLVASINHLRKTIESINATTSAMFNETFETVSRNFEQVFRRLFGGGRAEMRLVEEEGKTEPGLEILAQPPGKKVQNLNLLSAGEKAMTAIALLFAVFMAKPSPFCLLDEVDAPLDEANIFRFRDMLMEMKENTQFIIITHSQKTMSFAERLYGVTQEEEGVSKILMVSLASQKREELALSAA